MKSQVRHAVRPGPLPFSSGRRMSELEDPNPAGLQQELKSLKSPTDHRALQVTLLVARLVDNRASPVPAPDGWGREAPAGSVMPKLGRSPGGQTGACTCEPGRASEPRALLSALPQGAPCSHEASWENQGGDLRSWEAFFRTQKAGAHFPLASLDTFL